MVESVLLLLIATFMGSRIEKTGFWPLSVLLTAVFFGLCFIWQGTNDWPGWLSPEFSYAIGQMMISVAIGLFVGGFVVEWVKEKLAQAYSE